MAPLPYSPNLVHSQSYLTKNEAVMHLMGEARHSEASIAYHSGAIYMSVQPCICIANTVVQITGARLIRDSLSNRCEGPYSLSLFTSRLQKYLLTNTNSPYGPLTQAVKLENVWRTGVFGPSSDIRGPRSINALQHSGGLCMKNLACSLYARARWGKYSRVRLYDPART